MAINILDSFIINRISAGEVVESPFSIVKELIDNSLDAGSDKITIEIKNGGIDLISVKDNGKGIDYDDMKKAFLPHATSKIKDIVDLDNILTLGFRGEALASISNVSQTHLITKKGDSDCAYELSVNGGDFGEINATSSDNGTKIEVKNLFYNTPARRKFLKKPYIEANQITNIVSRYILANPLVSFKYIIDGEIYYQTKGDGLLNAIYSVYGKEYTQNMMYIENTENNYKLSGYISKVGFSKPNTTHQTLIINNRYVTDEIVSKAVFMAFEQYLMPRQFPVFVLNLEMPNVELDVNVHPNKMTVKFARQDLIYDLVYSAVSRAIYKSLNEKNDDQGSVEIKENQAKSFLIQDDLNDLKEIEISPVEIKNNTPNLTFKQETFSPITIFDLKKETNNVNGNIVNNEIKESKDTVNSLIKDEENTTSNLKDIKDFVDYKIVGEIFNEFIVLEQGDNMILLDFHAGHERLNYDKFCEILNKKELVTQDLLVPYVVKVSPEELNYILSLKVELNSLGFEIEQFEDNSIIISSIPVLLKDINIKNFIDDILHDMKNLRPKMDNEIKHYLMQKACKSSVKSGMSLSELEIRELLKNLDILNPVLLCPHGRPVISVVPKSQIEKWFKRIV